MVKPLKYESGKHLPFADKDKLNAGLVPISSQSGNLLQERSDGLYYGIEAPPDTSALYVSTSLGSDETGDGTKAKPYKTIYKAYSQNTSQTSCTIYLRYGETFVLTGDCDATQGAVKTIRTYDDPNFVQPGPLDPSLGRVMYSPESMAESTRAIIVPDGYVSASNGMGETYAFHADQASKWEFYNMEFRNNRYRTYAQCLQDEGLNTIPGGEWWDPCYFTSYSGTVLFFGCDFVNTTASETTSFVSTNVYNRQEGYNMQFYACRFIDNHTDGVSRELFRLGTGITISVVDDVGLTVRHEPWGRTQIMGNITDFFSSRKWHTGVVRADDGVAMNVVSNVSV